MNCSGIEEALERAYDLNAVAQMISKKAISLALHRYFLVKPALVTKLINFSSLAPRFDYLEAFNSNEVLLESATLVICPNKWK